MAVSIPIFSCKENFTLNYTFDVNLNLVHRWGHFTAGNPGTDTIYTSKISILYQRVIIVPILKVLKLNNIIKPIKVIFTRFSLAKLKIIVSTSECI